MKNKVYTLWTLILSLLIFCSTVKAQTLEFNTSQPLTVSSPGFFPFSTVSNNTFKEVLPTNDTLTLQFSNFLGNPCAVAPAADFGEIGPQLVVNANGTFEIQFSSPPVNADLFGLSLVPQSGGTCIFDLFIPPPAGTSSTSGGIITEGPSGDDTINPNAFTVFGTFLPDTLTEQLSNENNNPQCGNSPFGINPLVINGSAGDDTINLVINELGLIASSPQRNLNKAFKDEPETFTVAVPEGKNNANAVYVQKLTNTTDMTKIFVTGVFPSFSSESNLMVGRVADLDLEVTLKEQDLVALAAVQHAIVSATMPWQLSKNGGHFITQGGGCLSPFCVIVESGMVVIDTDGACTPDKLNKRRAGYPTFNPSKFFDPFPFASKTIQIPADNIVDPKHPLVSQVVRDNAYLILQPVPPGAKLNQQLKFMLKSNN